ncbi:MAG: hypothetical protein BGO68_01160 [Candidatus Amoebophilus sp. 36-38]|nr:MAG: hypothetical protein BGO68_01160 [Candidatus Amoebophilus sp. 36-38]
MGLRNKQLYHDKNLFFITSTSQDWLHLFIIGNSMQVLADNLNFYSKKYEVSILGYVFMPNHIHLIAHFPTSIHRIDFIRDFKSYTSKKILQEIEKYQPQQLEVLCFQRYKQNYKV